MNYKRIFSCVAILIFLSAGIGIRSLAGETIPESFFFNKLPQKTLCDNTLLKKIFASSGIVSVRLTSSQVLRGLIISHTKPNPSAETVNIRLLDYPKIVFTLSKIKLDDGSAKYIGHILSLDGNEALVLKQENKKYYFIKTEQRLLVTE